MPGSLGFEDFLIAMGFFETSTTSSPTERLPVGRGALLVGLGSLAWALVLVLRTRWQLWGLEAYGPAEALAVSILRVGTVPMLAVVIVWPRLFALLLLPWLLSVPLAWRVAEQVFAVQALGDLPLGPLLLAWPLAECLRWLGAQWFWLTLGCLCVALVGAGLAAPSGGLRGRHALRFWGPALLALGAALSSRLTWGLHRVLQIDPELKPEASLWTFAAELKVLGDNVSTALVVCALASLVYLLLAWWGGGARQLGLSTFLGLLCLLPWVSVGSVNSALWALSSPLPESVLPKGTLPRSEAARRFARPHPDWLSVRAQEPCSVLSASPGAHLLETQTAVPEVGPLEAQVGLLAGHLREQHRRGWPVWIDPGGDTTDPVEASTRWPSRAHIDLELGEEGMRLYAHNIFEPEFWAWSELAGLGDRLRATRHLLPRTNSLHLICGEDTRIQDLATALNASMGGNSVFRQAIVFFASSAEPER